MRNPPRPKLLPATLASAMQEAGVNQVELAKRTGLAVSRINNYLQGRYRTVTPGHLGAIWRSLGGAPAVNEALIQAYLYDLLPGAYRGLVDLCVAGAKDRGRWEPPTRHLTKEFAAALRELYILCVTNTTVRARTAEWIRIMRELSR